MRKNSINLLIMMLGTAFGLTACGTYTNTYDRNDSDDFIIEAETTGIVTYVPETTTSEITETPTTTLIIIDPVIDTPVTVETETTTPVIIEPETTTPVAVEPETTDTFIVSKDYADILRIATLQATCETNILDGYVNVESEHNPYDIVWDYGEEYRAYVNACDWSLVWDYDYYVKTFPMLAMLYHYDESLLLEHFQTVGIHEGRQGSAGFNFEAFKMNSDCPNYNSDFAAYFFDYMLKYDSYKNVNTVYKENGKPIYIQYKTIYTAAQLRELDAVNNYRQEVNVENLYENAELTCFANYRCYINLTENYRAHDWFTLDNFKNAQFCIDVLNPNMNMNIKMLSENCIEGALAGFPENYIYASDYRTSKDHYEAMINDAYDIIGISHVYHYSHQWSSACQFDAFIAFNN